MKTVDHKCPSCNASINYNPKSKNWVCEYCGSKFTLEQLEANEKNFESTSVKDSKELNEKAKEIKHILLISIFKIIIEDLDNEK